MNIFKIKINPLFLLLWIVFAFLKSGGEFLVYLVCVLIHEYAHIIAASNFGITLKGVSLTPYGGKIEGVFDGAKAENIVFICLFAPFVNAFIAGFVCMLWWFFPSLYEYTEIIVMANMSLCLINLIPAYPLDGGRVLQQIASKILKGGKALKLVKWVGIVIAALFFCSFVYILICFKQLNPTFLFFAVFMLFGSLVDLSKDTIASRLRDFNKLHKNSLPTEIRWYNVNENSTLQTLNKMIKGNIDYKFCFYVKNCKRDVVLSGEQVRSYIVKYGYTVTLTELFGKV